MTTARCPNGHEWPADATATPCPVCGGEPTMGTPPSMPDSRPPLALGSGGAGRGSQLPPELPRYAIGEELGRGGMGVVFKATQRDTGRVVALKMLLKERLGSGGDPLTRFRREALAAGRVAHPNIVQVYEADFDGDTPYLVMEYVPGIDLHTLLKRTGPLPLGQAADFVRQVAQALEHAWEQRLVHRDIKPSNLMVVAPTGLPLPPRAVVKVTDMGVARLFQMSEQEAPLTTLTRDGSVVGTVDYIAPEQIQDPRTVDIRADLYSLGCTFFHLLTGEVPFPGSNLVQKLDQHRWQTPRSVEQVRRDASRSLAAVVRRLMAKHPDDRYQTPGELATALETLLRTGELPGGHQTVSLVPARTLTGHVGVVTAVAFLDPRTLVSGGADRTVRTWDVETGQEKLRFGDGKYAVGCLAVTPSGMILAGQGVTVRGWDAKTGREVLRLTGHNDAVRCLAVTRDGKRAISGSDDRTIRIWDLERGREIQRFTKHKAGVTGVAVTADGRRVYSCSHDQSLRLWDATNGADVGTFAVPKGPVLCLALAASGEVVCTGHFDTTLRLWDVATGREVRRFSGHRQMIGGLVMYGDGQVVSASHDQTIRLWDTASGAELGVGLGHAGPVAAVAVSGDERWLASAGFDQAVRVWPIA